MKEGLFLRIHGLFGARGERRAATGSQALLSPLGLLLACAFFLPAVARAYGVSPPIAGLQLGLTAGVAIACGLACALVWACARASIYGAGLAFVTLEGVFRTLPTLLPPGALQAGSYAALLAVTAPLVAGAGVARSATIASACRALSMGLAGVAALALIFVYETEDGLIPTLIAGLGAGISAGLAIWFAVQAATQKKGRPLALTVACIHATTAWMLGGEAWLSNGADTSGSLIEVARLLLVTGALLGLALIGQRHGSAGDRRAGQDHADAEHVAQGELRVAELAGALDTQRQMNALISHELRAPLATISAAAQSLDMILSDSGEAVDTRLARIHRSVSRMTELMDQLLNQDRLGDQAWTPRGEHTDLAELARDVVTAMRPDTAHALLLDADDRLPVFCDRPLTSVVVRNLIHNAIKYSPANEPVRIEVGQIREGDAPMAWLAVVDRGPGIEEQDQPRVFEPHFRRSAHRETQGMGIGLYLARRICQNQGGSLTLHSKVGVGTRFVITLPVNAPGEPGADQAAKT